jgi:hypothetical protein
MGQLSSVGGVLARLQEKTPWGQRLARQKVLRYWDEVVGKAVVRVARPVEVRGKTLYVHVRDSVWLQQLNLMREDIRARLNAVVGEEAIDRIFFSLGPLSSSPHNFPSSGSVISEDARRIATEGITPKDPDVKALDHELEALQDPETRQQVRRALLRGELERRMKELR